MARAREIRTQIPLDRSTVTTSTIPSQKIQNVSLWLRSPLSDETGEDYRLYVDIGREPGTWRASGRRIEFSLDIRSVETGASASHSNGGKCSLAQRL